MGGVLQRGNIHIKVSKEDLDLLGELGVCGHCSSSYVKLSVAMLHYGNSGAG